MYIRKQNVLSTLRFFALGLCAVGLSGATVFAQSAQKSESAAAEKTTAGPQQQLRQEYQKISQQLQQAQQAAMETAEVQSAIELAQTTLKQKMLEFAPKKSEQIERFFALQDQLRNQAGQTSQEEMQAKIKELRGLQGNLQSAQQQAMQSDGFKKAQQDAQQAMQSAMMEENPKTQQLMRRQREIIQEVRSQQSTPEGAAPQSSD